MPIPPTLPRDPRQTPRTRRFLQKMANAVFNNGLPLPPNVAFTNTTNIFTQPQRIDSYFGAIHTDTDGATITFDMSVSNKHRVTLGGNRTLAVTNTHDGQVFMVILEQDGTGNRTVTWWSGIRWSGGVVPTLTVVGGKIDVFNFLQLASGQYLGFTTGLNF